MNEPNLKWTKEIEENSLIIDFSNDIFEKLCQRKDITAAVFQDSAIEIIIQQFKKGKLRYAYDNNHIDYEPIDEELKRQIISVALGILSGLSVIDIDAVMNLIRNTVRDRFNNKIYHAKCSQYKLDSKGQKIINAPTPKNSDYDYWWEFENGDTVIVTTNCEYIKNGLAKFGFEFDDEDEKNSAIESAEDMIQQFYSSKILLSDFIDAIFVETQVKIKDEFNLYTISMV